MGVVYLGRTDSGELAAVKVTHADQADQADFRERFRREVVAARRVVSRWAVPVLGADPDAPEPWMATAFVPGPSLGEAVRGHGALPERSVRILGGAVARALAAVHAAGLVHRDVKPGNVLLAVDGPRLIDFGIARTTGETGLTSADMVVGTPGFLAPEQAEARADETGPAADVFALGCLLAFAATGRPPFGTGAVDALLYRTVHDEPDLRGVPEPLLDLVRRCLAKRPADRPTADEVAGLLSEDAPGAPADWLPAPVVRTIAERSARMLALPAIDATAAGAPTAPPAGPGRRRFLLLGAGAAVLAAGGGIAAWANLGDDGKGPGDDKGKGKAPVPVKRTTWAVGVYADLSGPAKEIGQAQERGARLAVEAFNAKRQGKPFRIELKVSDEAGDPVRATRTARELTTDPGVLVVLGPTNDAVGQASSAAFQGAGVPLITTSAGYNLLTRGTEGAPNETVLRAVPNHIMAGMHLGYALGLLDGVRRPGILEERTDDHYSWQVARGAGFGLGQEGLKARYRVVPGRATDYKSILAGMIDDGMDAYVHVGVRAPAVLAARALAELRFTGPKFTGQAVFGSGFLKEAGAAAEGWFVTAPVLDPNTRKEAAGFVAAHRAKYGTAPAFYAAESYDVVTMALAQLVAQGGAGPTRKGLWQALRKGKYTGVMGGYTFDENGDLSGGGTFVYGVQGGAYKLIGSAPAVPKQSGKKKT
ncbi:bifunctional serine/threonine-protein kinase/ABC transporter substrate-binding protein [Streptomyces sp. NPDC090025]|uniref:bifunctional serine/threonine-protein kinase/ABC transporter substrate-binding protein n=1 Tax=Streptomyces sp. NPDC090025 TaxID=3365922 RepID=UPI003838F1CD